MLYTHPTKALRLARFPLYLVLVLAALITVSGCSKHLAERMQVEQAESNLAEAQQSGGEQLTPQEYSQASDTVDAARLAIVEKEWDDAMLQGQLGHAQSELSEYRADKLHAQKRFDAVVYGPED